MFSYHAIYTLLCSVIKSFSKIAIYFYQLNLEVDKMFVDKIKLTRQCNHK